MRTYEEETDLIAELEGQVCPPLLPRTKENNWALAWAMKACSRIFEYQTADEQNSDDTREHNGVGFTGADAFILSRFAKSIDEGKFVGSPKQMAILFKKMPKYAKQLDGIAQTKVEAA